MERSRRSDLVALVVYAATAFAYFGWRLVPHPGRVVVGPAGDPSIFIWSFAWWPHALGAGTNPFHSGAIFAPDGLNLAWATSVPGLALAFSPLTVLFGPIVSFNVAETLMPALAAWTAYLLCRYLFRSFWAALVGGYLFGFSSYVLGQLNEGHMHLTAVFLLPLVALVVVRRLRGELSGRGLAWRLGVLLALQLTISTEVALSLTVALAVGLLLAYALVAEVRAGVRGSLAPIAAGYGIAALLAAPLVVYVLVGGVPGSFSGAELSRSDLLNFAIPTKLFGLGGSSLAGVSGRFPRGGQEQGAYLGLPLLLVLALLAVRVRRSAAVRFLLASAAVAALVALGDSLRVAGDRVVALPWALAAHLPLLDNAAPSRFTVYLWLAVAVAVALWTATTRGLVFARPYVLPALAVAALLPAVWGPYFHVRVDEPAFFADRLFEGCVPRGETLAVFPLVQPGRDSMLWQAGSDFWFRMAGGSIGPGLQGIAPLERDQSEPVAWELNYLYDAGRPTMARLLAYAALHHVGRIVSLEAGGYPSAAQLRRIGSVQRLGGMLVAPACGRPPLTARNLTPYVRAYDEELRSGAEIGYCTGVNYSSLPVGLYPAGALAKARPASFVPGRGLTCEPPPAGYVRRGFATADMGVRERTYPLYVPRGSTG